MTIFPVTKETLIATSINVIQTEMNENLRQLKLSQQTGSEKSLKIPKG
jgi:hypothetical protein